MMVVYAMPAYIPAFQQSYSTQVVYAAGTINSPGTVITPGTVISHGSLIAPRQVVAAGRGTVVQSISGESVILQPVIQPANVTVINQIRDPGLARSSMTAATNIVNGVIQGAAKGLIYEMDKLAKSPLLDCFSFGCSVQLRSKKGGRMLCVNHKDKTLDCNGDLGNDYNAHYLVVAKSDNKVILRNGEYSGCHLSTNDGLPCSSVNGTYFRIHETTDHYVTLQHNVTGEFIGVDGEGNLLPTQFVQWHSEEAKFEVNLVYSPFNHVYEPSH